MDNPDIKRVKKKMSELDFGKTTAISNLSYVADKNYKKARAEYKYAQCFKSEGLLNIAQAYELAGDLIVKEIEKIK